MGVLNSGPVYDIVEITEDRMVIHADEIGGDCSHGPEQGFFTLIFTAQ